MALFFHIFSQITMPNKTTALAFTESIGFTSKNEMLEVLSPLQILPYAFYLCFGFELTYSRAAADPREAAPVN